MVNLSALNVINNDRGSKICLCCCDGEVDGGVGCGG